MNKELNSIKDVKTYADFCNWFNIEAVLANSLIDVANEYDMSVEFYNGSGIYYYGPDGECYSESELEELEDENSDNPEFDINDYTAEYEEFSQYYVVSENDAKNLARYADETIIYISEMNIYLWCVDHYGTSWDYVPITLQNITI